MRKYSNYLLIVIAVVLLVGNLYENQFHIGRENVWRIVSALCFMTLGIVNIINLKKNENRRI